MIKNLSAASGSYVCPKCGTAKKSGVSSCCARGGSWFRSCGDARDTKFNHTWVEGIQACKGFVTLVAVESRLQAMLHPMQGIGHPLGTAKPRKTRNKRRISTISTEYLAQEDTQQKANVDRIGRMFSAASTDCINCVGFVKLSVCICVLFIALHS